jgi:thioredoxin
MNKLTKEEFEQKMASGEPFVVDFYADWCQSCVEMMPVVEEVAGKSDVPFYKVNIDEEPELKEQNRIKAIPMVMMYKSGRVREFLYGKNDTQKLEQKLTRLKNY